MDGRGGCCVARYGGGVYDVTSKVDRIMLRFRPIAPKPAGESISGGSTPDITEKCRTGSKRKYVKAKRCNNKRRKPSSSSPKRNKGNVAPKVATTLSFLPENPESRDSRDFPEEERSSRSSLSFERNNKERKIVKMVRPRRVVGSTVTVDCVTEYTCVDGGGMLGFTDEERRMCLHRDSCPCFVSVCYGRVVWTNKAYRSMVMGSEEEINESTDEVTVRLVVKETTAMTCPAFTCRMRVQHYTCGSLTVPCDVWRMEEGGFTWRLDVKAALCLGQTP